MTPHVGIIHRNKKLSNRAAAPWDGGGGEKLFGLRDFGFRRLAVTLRCICGAEIRGVEDLFFWAGDGLLQARCRKPHCRLAKTLTVERVKDRAVIRFSKMFTDYNMLFMGRDLLEKSLEELGRRIARQLPELNGLKPHTTHQ